MIQPCVKPENAVYAFKESCSCKTCLEGKKLLQEEVDLRKQRQERLRSIKEFRKNRI